MHEEARILGHFIHAMDKLIILPPLGGQPSHE
jgi:hypothetical protein